MSLPDTVPVLRELRLRNFRNFQDVSLSIPPAGAAVIGDNGSGKTNLLEAIYYLEIFRSFRGAPDDQLVRFGCDAFHIRGVFHDPSAGRDLEISVGYEAKSTGDSAIAVGRLAQARGASARAPLGEGFGLGADEGRVGRVTEVVVRAEQQHRPAVETAVVWRPSAASPVLRRFLRLALSTPEPDVLGPERARRGRAGRTGRR